MFAVSLFSFYLTSSIPSVQSTHWALSMLFFPYTSELFNEWKSVLFNQLGKEFQTWSSWREYTLFLICMDLCSFPIPGPIVTTYCIWYMKCNVNWQHQHYYNLWYSSPFQYFWTGTMQIEVAVLLHGAVLSLSPYVMILALCVFKLAQWNFRNSDKKDFLFIQPFLSQKMMDLAQGHHDLRTNL